MATRKKSARTPTGSSIPASSGLTPLEIYRICHEQFRDENARRDHFQVKAGLLLTACVVVGTAAIAVGRLDLIGRVFTRVDLSLYYLACSCCWLSLAVAVVYLARTLWPVQYALLETMDLFVAWRDGYCKELIDAEYDPMAAKEIANAAMINAIIKSTCKATGICRQSNLGRQEKYSKALFATTIAVAWLAIMAIFSRLIILQGVT